MCVEMEQMVGAVHTACRKLPLGKIPFPRRKKRKERGGTEEKKPTSKLFCARRLLLGAPYIGATFASGFKLALEGIVHGFDQCNPFSLEVGALRQVLLQQLFTPWCACAVGEGKEKAGSESESEEKRLSARERRKK